MHVGLIILLALVLTACSGTDQGQRGEAVQEAADPVWEVASSVESADESPEGSVDMTEPESSVESVEDPLTEEPDLGFDILQVPEYEGSPCAEVNGGELFFSDADIMEEAIQKGYDPCKRCKP